MKKRSCRVIKDVKENRGWCILIDESRYLTNKLEVVSFTFYAATFPNNEVPKVGSPGSIWYSSEELAKEALAAYLQNIFDDEEWVTNI